MRLTVDVKDVSFLNVLSRPNEDPWNLLEKEGHRMTVRMELWMIGNRCEKSRFISNLVCEDGMLNLTLLEG